MFHDVVSHGRCLGAANASKIGAAVSEAKLISVIDDDASVACSTGSLVRSLGFDALTFTSAEDFLRSGRRQHTACIICDVQMPGMSGIDLYETLTAQGSRIPFIFITAFSENRVRQLAGNTACILHKPFEAAELVSCLEDSIQDS
jgi:FixJ family two-component response regulator